MCVCTLLLLPSAACFVGGRAACALQPDYHADALAAAGQARAAPPPPSTSKTARFLLRAHLSLRSF